MRLCIINNDKSELYTFHCWEQFSEVIPPSMTTYGHGGGQVSAVRAVLESSDGRVGCYLASKITFVDSVLSDEDLKQAASTSRILRCYSGNGEEHGTVRRYGNKLIIRCHTAEQDFELFTELDEKEVDI